MIEIFLLLVKKTHKFTWEITIPDSIAENSENMYLVASKYDFISKSSREVDLLRIEITKKLLLLI
jgi:hypothetical protein